MSQYVAAGGDTRPLLQEEDSCFNEDTEERLERLRDGSPRYGTFHRPIPTGSTPIVQLEGQILPPSQATVGIAPTAVVPVIPQPTNMSSSPSERRKRYKLSFLILISFDVGLVAFLSVICYLTATPNDHTALGYFDVTSFESSVFDLVLLSFTRFVFDCLFYLILGWITRIILFLTTLMSACYVPIKAYFYWENLTENGQDQVILYLIVLLLLFFAFAVPWLIAFFFEFKYLPSEKSRVVVTTWWDYKPWLCPWLLAPKQAHPLLVAAPNPQQSIPHAQVITRQPPHVPIDRYQSMDTVFRTPVGSVRGSPTSFVVVDNQEGDLDPIREHEPTPSPEALPPAECDLRSPVEEEYCRHGNEALQSLIEYSQSTDGWNLVKEQDRVQCYSYRRNSRKIWKTEMIVPVSTDRLWTVIFYDVENTRKWNTGIDTIEVVQKIDANTDVMYTLCTTIGPVSPRDFVTVRRWEVIGGVHYDANISATHPSKPAQRDPIRGENGAGGYAVVPINAQTCKFIWIMNSDLKGWIPQSLLDQLVPSSMINTNKSLRSYVIQSAIPS